MDHTASTGKVSDGRRPPLETKVLFRGIHGRLELDLSGKDKNQAGAVLPTFYSLAGKKSLSQNGFTRQFVPLPKRCTALAVRIVIFPNSLRETKYALRAACPQVKTARKTCSQSRVA